MSEARIADPVHAAAQTQPDAPALVTPGETLTYAELDRRVTAAAERLRGHGLGRGDRLAIYRPTDTTYLVLLLAGARTGVVIAPISTRLPPAVVPELLGRIACRVLVAAPDPAWVGLRVVDVDVLTTDAAGTADSSAWQLDASATLVFTSGSTGTPKAALHTLGNHYFSALGSTSNIPLAPGDRWLLNLPLYHVGGLAVLFRCVLAGAAVVLPEPGVTVESVFAEQGVTHVSMVGTQLLRVLRGPMPDTLGGLKALLLGGSAIAPGLLDEAHARGLPVHTSYGLTEMASTVTATPPGASRGMLGTSGVALPHRGLGLASDGEILVRGATLFAGYVEDGMVRRPVGEDGWFATGDLGEWANVGGEQMLCVVGRKDNLFVSGGENVQPEEIEAVMGRQPGVCQALVVPVADDEFGQRPVAFVEADAWNPEAWRVALAGALPRFKVPDAFLPWPKDAQAGMKVSRVRMRERARASWGR